MYRAGDKEPLCAEENGGGKKSYKQRRESKVLQRADRVLPFIHQENSVRKVKVTDLFLVRLYVIMMFIQIIIFHFI